MNEHEIVNRALMLERKTYGVRNRLTAARAVMDMMSKHLENLNDDEAKRIYEQYWHQYTEQLKIFRNLSRHEIYRIVRQRQTCRNICLKLLQAGRNLTGAALKIRSWRFKLKLAADAYELFRKVKQQNEKQECLDAISQINGMREAKENMRLAMQLTNNLIQQCRLPFVTEFVNLYTVIFDELCNFCDKIADYAKHLVVETEKVLGHKGELSEVIADEKTLFNRTKKASADPDSEF